ncbi:septum formation family protein [Arthrobacter sp. Sa2BUA2]|uniref:Septum formation family protein n=1 Tax=Arthrobacter pullicola TaxID=2762224 RepID=A0ABR8YK32_9MICC|nr:septum formation family protein [Arthrobacter pullicola]MBD8044572.1 septum formation family protein [Arthrobacter pullicola]
MSDQKRTPRAGLPLPGKSLRPSPPVKGNAVPKGSGAAPPAAKAAPPVRNNPATRSIPVIKPQQPADSGRPAPGASPQNKADQPGKAGKPGKTGKRAPGAKRPAPAKKGTVAKGLLGSKGGAKRPPLRTGPGAKNASGPADEPTSPEPTDHKSEPAQAAEPGSGSAEPAAEQANAPEPAPVPILADLVSHTEAPAWLSRDGSRDVEVWTEVFESETLQAAPLEPVVIPAEDVHLVEPSLDTPSISAEAAEAASLLEAAAEVRAVSEEAAEAGKQAGITEPAPEGTEIAVDAGEGLTELEPATGDAAAQPEADGSENGEETEESAAAPERADPVEPAEPGEKADPVEPAEPGTAPDQLARPAEDTGDAAADAEADTEAGSDEVAGAAGSTEAAETTESEPDEDSADTAEDGGAADIAGTSSPAGSTGAQPIIATAVVSGDSTDVSAPVTDSFASLSLTKKVPAGDPADTGITHVVRPSGSTAVPADSRRARRTREAEEAAAKISGSSRTTRMLVLIGSILIIVLLGIWLATVVADSNREEGVLEDSVAPIDLEAGACIQDFQSVNAEVTVVTCDTPHNAQLVASESYLNSDSFPGPDALAAKAEEVCSSVMYTDAASKYADLELNRAVPTQSSWDAGDRRVDCFVVAPGEELSESLIVQP